MIKNHPLGGAPKLFDKQIWHTVKIGPFLGPFFPYLVLFIQFLSSFLFPFLVLFVPFFGPFWSPTGQFGSLCWTFCPLLICASAEIRSESKQTKRWPPSGKKVTKKYL